MRLELLFHQNGMLSDFLDKRKKDLNKEIDGYEEDYLLKVKEEEILGYLISKYSVDPIIIHDDKIYLYDKKDVDIDVSWDRRRAFYGDDGPVHVKGTQYTFAVPFNGDPELFNYKPSHYTMNPPKGTIKKGEIYLIYECEKIDSEGLKKLYRKDLNEIKRYSEWIRNEVNPFNDSLELLCKNMIKKMKDKFSEERDVIEGLGIPIKRRDDAPETYVVPEIKRKPKINIPVIGKSEKPEPTFSYEEYENVLTIIQNMVLVIERSPKAFVNMWEENLRFQFLVQLNGQYEGLATGETFNFDGKTDILIRYEGKNIFIAECKFWRGEKELVKTIDQLLGYTSWRDTKTAIILFNKNKEFSSVLEKIDPVVTSHPSFVKKHKLSSDKLQEETIFSYFFHQPDDKKRELLLTVMVFNIPVN